MRLSVEQILEAADADVELMRAPETLLPADLEITGDIAQHWLASAEKAERVLGWVHADPEPCVRASVRWHLEQPPAAAVEDFNADDRALAGAATGPDLG